MTTETFRHTQDMGEISGFGGGYERCCQDMLEAGVKFLIEKQGAADFRVLENPNIYGIVKLEGADSEALEKAVLEGAKGGATGAMHHAVMVRLAYIAKKGWKEYCIEIRKAIKDEKLNRRLNKKPLGRKRI